MTFELRQQQPAFGNAGDIHSACSVAAGSNTSAARSQLTTEESQGWSSLHAFALHSTGEESSTPVSYVSTFNPMSIGQAQQSAVSMPLQAPTGRRTVFQYQSDSRSGLPALEKPTSSSPLLCHRPSQSQPLQEEKQSHHGPQRLFELNRRHASGFGGGWYGEN